LIVFSTPPFDALDAPTRGEFRSCQGVYPPRPDRVDYGAWTAWFDVLEQCFEQLDMTVSRRGSPAKAYVAGFPSTKGEVCASAYCALKVAPFNIALPAGTTNQATITVQSAPRN
jgi:hypothetical protein